MFNKLIEMVMSNPKLAKPIVSELVGVVTYETIRIL